MRAEMYPVGKMWGGLNAWGHTLAEYIECVGCNYMGNGMSTGIPHMPLSPFYNGVYRLRCIKMTGRVMVINDADAKSLKATWYSMVCLENYANKFVWIMGGGNGSDTDFADMWLLSDFFKNSRIEYVIYVGEGVRDLKIKNIILTVIKSPYANVGVCKELYEAIDKAHHICKEIIKGSNEEVVALIYSPGVCVPPANAILFNRHVNNYSWVFS